MTSRLARAAVSLLVLASAAGAASATVTEYTNQTAYGAATSGSTIFNFDDVTPPGTVSLGDVTLGDLSFSASIPIVVGSGAPLYGGKAFFTSLSATPGIDAAEVLCTLSGTRAIGFIYGDFADGGGLPFTVTLSTGDSFDLSTPFNPGLDTGFIGFVSNTPITSIRFSNNGVGFDVLEVVSSSAGAAGVPEPAPSGLMATGLLALALLSRRRAVKVEIGQQLKTDS
jgi:hypothetical protein